MKLKSTQINRLAQLVNVVNTYDSLCHPVNPKLAHTPHSALSVIYRDMKSQLNMEDVTVLVRLLGVYPPGSVVGLSNGAIGLVMSVNPNKLLYPHVLLYDPNIPRTEAPIIDLEQDRLTIKKVFKLNQLKKEVLEYLSPRQQLNYVYYFDDASK
jgi:hypothetical protein